jgi:hypothetical protein
VTWGLKARIAESAETAVAGNGPVNVTWQLVTATTEATQQ